MDRLRDLADLVIAAAWTGAMGFGVGALVVTMVTTLEQPLGFGARFFGWPVVAALFFLPAVFVWWFARNARLMRDRIVELPDRLAGLAEDSITQLVGVVSAARDTVSGRRGLVQLVSGVWQVRNVTGSLREAAGITVPLSAAFAPTSLLVTAIAAAGGIAVLGLAALLVVIRVLV